jgi:hypothetical protein
MPSPPSSQTCTSVHVYSAICPVLAYLASHDARKLFLVASFTTKVLHVPTFTPRRMIIDNQPPFSPTLPVSVSKPSHLLSLIASSTFANRPDEDACALHRRIWAKSSKRWSYSKDSMGCGVRCGVGRAWRRQWWRWHSVHRETMWRRGLAA